jgi:hypothetical protein
LPWPELDRRLADLADRIAAVTVSLAEMRGELASAAQLADVERRVSRHDVTLERVALVIEKIPTIEDEVRELRDARRAGDATARTLLTLLTLGGPLVGAVAGAIASTLIRHLGV